MSRRSPMRKLRYGRAFILWFQAFIYDVISNVPLRVVAEHSFFPRSGTLSKWSFISTGAHSRTVLSSEKTPTKFYTEIKEEFPEGVWLNRSNKQSQERHPTPMGRLPKVSSAHNYCADFFLPLHKFSLNPAGVLEAVSLRNLSSELFQFSKIYPQALGHSSLEGWRAILVARPRFIH